ncbi:oxygen-dependent protoporphyrinogen oxidase [Jeotgalicoccus aerolatus]|uniref:Coproporphyrinogen III oxidase n=1 Tax=Jeotgalicoccus aerolatus TaxID=709510 RepID=A0A1G9CV56_9STAP|nr:protoporphyrinogen oxidase [Jeotgalicoccus aerolatus]NMA80582.1 protoporphyrinogen oxidase [Jeotgalicoccus aerolatus]SDK55526.1 oxygen-dependent protoporphyrinogen oxidase [Jeotgalicoccus aerolatus]HJG33083.1 protoporphyrinogen oxidase [Jeotgalicoccus aerolatus]
MKRVAIIGAGITGLSAMHYLLKEGKDLTVDLFEASGRAGGKVNTHSRDGYTIELGPESYLARKEVMTELAYEVGLGDTLVRNQTGQAYIYAKNKLSPVPKGTMLGVPMALSPLLTTDLVSWTGKLRAGLDFLKPAMPLYKDISVGEFFRARFGDDLLEHMIEPLLAGVYGTDIDQLSLMSTYPNFKETEEAYGSLMKGLIAEKKDKPAAPKTKTGAFLQFKNGLQSFIDRLVSENEKRGGQIHFNFDVTAIEKTEDGYDLTADGGTHHYDEVIVTTPHFQYKRWFKDKEFEYFKHMEATSVATVVMAFDEEQVKNTIEGTGFVISRNMDTSITACTWTNKKWEHSTPEGKALLRAYVGRPGDFIVHEKSDEDIVRLAREDLDKIMDLDGEPEFTIVTRMMNAMPNYFVGHKYIIDDIQKYAAENYPGLHLIGASHYAVGLPDCVQTAKDTAEKILNK